MKESEGREIAALPKWGEPRSDWSQTLHRPNVLTNAFGLLNEEQQSIKGLQADFDVFISPRLGQVRYVFSIKQYEQGLVERAYQQDINLRKGLKSNEHAYSHEHYGEVRFTADPSWAALEFNQAVERFCRNANLTLTDPMPHYEGFVLK